MSAIDDLKNGAEQPRHVSIDLTQMGNKNERRSLSLEDVVKTKSTVDDTNAINQTDSNQTYIQSILDTENPNSDFMKHVAEKEQEAAEWIAEQNEKNALAKEAAEHELDKDDDDDELDDRGGVAIDITKPPVEEDLENPEMTAGEDLSNSEVVSFDLTSNNDDEEKEPVKDDTAVHEVEETKEEPVEVVTEPTPIPEAAPKKKEEKKKEIFKSDIDLEVDQETESSLEDDKTDEEETTVLDDNTDDNEEYNRLRQITSERLKPVALNLDLSSFTIAKKAKVDVGDALKAYKAKVSKWVLFNQKCTVHMKEFSGSELETMMEYYQASRRSADAMRRMYNMIYDHIASAKPANFETWLKVTPFSDLDNYFFAIYIASFNGANYIPIDCTNNECGKSYITENVDIMNSMVHFETKEERDKFTDLYKSEAKAISSGVYVSEVVPLNYKIAIGFKEASLWDIIEINSIDTATANEFSSIIEYIPYIDNLYLIDMENNRLTPVGYNTYPENPQKTTRAKIKKYNKVFSALTVDEFTPVKAYVSALLDKTSRGISYVIPETTCPECGHVNPERPIQQGQVADMVFTRCQLGALVTTSIN
ncbi:MAG: hypothetical protein IKR19_08220 [Acholeplasmatales bacterium]|nr:hypothetical protein [Acholeplasmatales bacterium]